MLANFTDSFFAALCDPIGLSFLNSLWSQAIVQRVAVAGTGTALRDSREGSEMPRRLADASIVFLVHCYGGSRLRSL